MSTLPFGLLALDKEPDKWQRGYLYNCPATGQHATRALYGGVFCTVCGEYHHSNKEQALRWVPTPVWWKPWTWLNGYWVTKEIR